MLINRFLLFAKARQKREKKKIAISDGNKKLHQSAAGVKLDSLALSFD